MVFGAEPESLLDRFLSSEGIISEHTTWGTRMREAHDFVINDLRASQDATAAMLRAKNSESNFFRPFSIGDIVWLRNNATVGEHKKLRHDFKQNGPYRITSLSSQYSYVLEHVESLKTRRAHYSWLTLVDSKLQAQYGQSTTREEGKEIVVSSNLVAPTTAEVTNRRVTFVDSEVNSSHRLKSPPPALPKARVLPTQSSRTVVLEKSKDNSTPTLRMSVPADHPVPSTSRYGRERRKPKHLMSLASAEEEGGSDVTP